VDEDAGRLRLGPHLKSFPPSSWGRSVADLVAAATTLDAFTTPVLTLDAARRDLSTDEGVRRSGWSVCRRSSGMAGSPVPW
jgi:hypothetical protein